MNGIPSVAVEGRFVSESELHELIRLHPEILPSEDAGLGPLTVVASKKALERWEPDLLAVDPRGRLVVVEFKRGTENSDVRRVIAQMMDYGSLLWKMDFDLFEQKCKESQAFSGSLADHVGENLKGIGHTEFDVPSFTDALRQELISGQFVFMYVARDLDVRTERVMGYLAETSRMWFFAVEVDCFRDPETTDIAAIVPRTRFVPPWVLEELSASSVRSTASTTLADQPPEVKEFVSRLDSHVVGLGLSVANAPTGRSYKLPSGLHVLGVYWGSSRGLEFNLDHLRAAERDREADDVLTRVSRFVGHTITATKWPTVPLIDATARADDTIRECIDPFLRIAMSADRRQPSPIDTHQ